MLVTAGEHDVTVQPVLAGRHLGERHANLKSNARLFRKNANRPDSADRCDNLVEECPDLRRLSAKVIAELVATARMRLIPVREVAPTFIAVPEARLFHRCDTRRARERGWWLLHDCRRLDV